MIDLLLLFRRSHALSAHLLVCLDISGVHAHRKALLFHNLHLIARLLPFQATDDDVGNDRFRAIKRSCWSIFYIGQRRKGAKLALNKHMRLPYFLAGQPKLARNLHIQTLTEVAEKAVDDRVSNRFWLASGFEGAQLQEQAFANVPRADAWWVQALKLRQHSL